MRQYTNDELVTITNNLCGMDLDTVERFISNLNRNIKKRREELREAERADFLERLNNLIQDIREAGFSIDLENLDYEDIHCEVAPCDRYVVRVFED